MRIGVGLVAVVTASTACGGSGLTEASLNQRVGPALTGTVTTCPVDYDVAAAATSSGIAGDVAPADTDPVWAENESSPAGSDVLEQNAPAVDLECDYRIGDTDVTTYVLATSRPDSAVGGLLPEIAYLSHDDPATLLTTILPAETDSAVPSPSGRAAVVRLDVQDGDGAFVVGVDPGDGISATQLSTFAEALAGRLD